MTALIDRIHHSLVGLKMPRAIEAPHDIVRRIERGEIGARSALLIVDEIGYFTKRVAPHLHQDAILIRESGVRLALKSNRTTMRMQIAAAIRRRT